VQIKKSLGGLSNIPPYTKNRKTHADLCSRADVATENRWTVNMQLKRLDRASVRDPSPENEAELPSHADRCTSLSHLIRCTTEAKWKRSNDWFQLKSVGKNTIVWMRNTTRTKLFPESKSRQFRFISS
jgi:hypothetical protein